MTSIMDAAPIIEEPVPPPPMFLSSEKRWRISEPVMSEYLSSTGTIIPDVPRRPVQILAVFPAQQGYYTLLIL
jgi:hypothetical protein